MYCEAITRFESDHPNAEDCQIRGTVPSWLNGSLYRIGPGLFHIGDDKFQHLLDGMAVIQHFTVKDGTVSYRNRLVQSETYLRNVEANRIVVNEFGTVGIPDPTKSLFSRYFSYYFQFVQKPTDNTSVSLLTIGRHMYALTETARLNEIEPCTLGTKRHISLRDYVSMHMATAHPLKDSEQTVWNIGSYFGFTSQYVITKMRSPDDDTEDHFLNMEVVCKIPTRWRLEPSYYHSFGMSDNYIVLIEQNLTIPFMNLIKAPLRHKPFSDLFQYYPEEKCLFHVFNKKTGKLVDIKFVAKSFFVLHHINTYEDGGHLVVDICAFHDAIALEMFKLDRMKIESNLERRKTYGVLWRFVLPLEIDDECTSENNLVKLDYTRASAKLEERRTVFCSPEIFSDCVIEVPNVRPNVAGKMYRYCYGLSIPDGCSDAQIIKYDIINKKMIFWCDARYVPGEPIFIASQEGNAEDDGILLSPLISYDKGQSSILLILDATTMTEVARAEIDPNINVPFTFHGYFEEFVE